MYGIGLAAMVWVSIRYLVDASPRQLAAIPAIWLGASLVEYVIHRWVMHVRRWWIGPAWDGHVGRHHHFFSDRKPAWDRSTDVWLVLFSHTDVLALTAFVAGPVALIWNLISPVAGAITVVSFISYFLFYEACHLSFHLPDDHWVLKLPRVQRMRDHHSRHHRPTNADGNYAIVLSVWDHLFRTKLPS
jgi:sterol desaturase/sphingolipid hydroxylase (fatty acid hydroxylase superfamily)